MEALSLPIPVMWIEPIWLGVQILLILLVGYVAQRVVARFLTGLGERYPLPTQLVIILRGVLRWLIMGSALLFVLAALLAACQQWASQAICLPSGLTRGPARSGLPKNVVMSASDGRPWNEGMPRSTVRSSLNSSYPARTVVRAPGANATDGLMPKRSRS